MILTTYLTGFNYTSFCVFLLIMKNVYVNNISLHNIIYILSPSAFFTSMPPNSAVSTFLISPKL